MKHCDNCGRELLDEAVICPSCKTDLRIFSKRQSRIKTKKCLNCANPLLEEAVKCPKCGMLVDEAERELTKCSNCGKVILQSETVCRHCGYDRSKNIRIFCIVLGVVTFAVFVLFILSLL